jgi:hypothetical protein
VPKLHMSPIHNTHSNFEVRVEAKGKESFACVLKLFFDEHTKLKRYEIKTDKDGGEEMIMFSYGEYGLPLPYELNYEGALEFLWNWLKVAKLSEYPDIDGSVRKEDGFIITNSGSYSPVVLKVMPVYVEYHK